MKNPFDTILNAVGNDASRLSALFEQNRLDRNVDQRELMLSATFPGVTVDSTLQRLIDPTINPPYVDSRNAVSLWARPPPSIRRLIAAIQQRLLALSPSLWVMPPDKLHLSILEIVHSTTPAIVADIISQLTPHLPDILRIVKDHPTCLSLPQLACDSASVVLKFIPTEQLSPGYTYLHLRRDLFEKVDSLGVQMHSRYIAPSAHITIARFVSKSDFETNEHADQGKMAEWWALIDDLNVWLASLPHDEASYVVSSVECRFGAQWYGGGQSVGDEGQS